MFWDVFSSLCAEKGVSPNTVAATIGCKSTGTVTGWKNGAIPRNSVKLKLANYFGVEASVFNEDVQQKEKPAIQTDSELYKDVDYIISQLEMMPEEKRKDRLKMIKKMVEEI